jgi:cytochrome c oxidase assembly protein subunit 15
MGMVFLIGFTYFLVKKKFSKSTVIPMVVLFVLGGIQGAIGWIMVKSGLVPEKYFVGHVELTIHFIAALILLSYTLWFAMSYLQFFRDNVQATKLNKILYFILFMLFLQLIYGGFMAGLKAASTAPTWPSINGSMVPSQMNELFPWADNLINNKIAIHFIHRGLGYFIFILSVIFFIKSKKLENADLFKKVSSLFFALVMVQIILGITALLTSTNPAVFVFIGVAHQFTAMLIVLTITTLLFLANKRSTMRVESI